MTLKGLKPRSAGESLLLRRMSASSLRRAQRLLKSGAGSDASTSLPRLKRAPRGSRRMSSAL
jgi:hypothetical protein